MAVVTFSGPNVVAEARALATTLNLWLREQEPPTAVPPATVHFAYSDSGDLKSVTVSLSEQD
ncbi:hypothetical protein D3C77_599750 [compost metagenome]